MGLRKPLELHHKHRNGTPRSLLDPAMQSKLAPDALVYCSRDPISIFLEEAPRSICRGFCLPLQLSLLLHSTYSRLFSIKFLSLLLHSTNCLAILDPISPSSRAQAGRILTPMKPGKMIRYGHTSTLNHHPIDYVALHDIR
jgi:hypothetical protein